MYKREKLNLLGVPEDKIGYKYIIDAALIWNEYEETNHLKIYDIYGSIALKYDKKHIFGRKSHKELY